MNPDVKKRWVDALRSGRYRQATGRLTVDGGFCCLGVLCELAVEDGVLTRTTHPSDSTFDLYVDSDYETLIGNLSSGKVREWAGLPTSVPLVYTADGWAQLTVLNDKRKLPFHRIADWIEASL